MQLIGRIPCGKGEEDRPHFFVKSQSEFIFLPPATITLFLSCDPENNAVPVFVVAVEFQQLSRLPDL